MLYCGNEFPENTKYGGLTDPQNFLPMKISPPSANDTAHLAFLDHNTILDNIKGKTFPEILEQNKKNHVR